jgi:hypothetical protein
MLLMNRFRFFIVILFLHSACSSKSLHLSTPNMGVSASIIQIQDAYFALFPESENDGFNCGKLQSADIKKFSPSKKLVIKNEKDFQENYYKWLVSSAENLHPDSSALIVEYPGDYMLVKEASHRKLVRIRKKEYRESIQWDRQYLGFINSKLDSVLVINLIKPDKYSRKKLGEGWRFFADAALEDIYTFSYNLGDSSITSDFCSTLK